jgi:hypothetical protein
LPEPLGVSITTLICFDPGTNVPGNFIVHQFTKVIP